MRWLVSRGASCAAGLPCATIGGMDDEAPEDGATLPLFSGPHLARFRFDHALEALDLHAALADAPAAWREDVALLAGALGDGGPASADLRRLLDCRRDGWAAPIERAWQRLAGRRLDGKGIPGTLAGEPAAAFLLRGGERARALASLDRHLHHHPRDARGWELFAAFDPVRGAARCAFHGGAVLEAAVPHLLDLLADDEIEPPGPWLLVYAWFTREIELDDIAAALAAERIAAPPLRLPHEARAFAWYLLDAGGRPLGAEVGIVEARARLQQISAAAFRRYLARVAGR